MANAFDFDFFVIGGGSGGVRAARIAASLGARVGLAEEKALGGTCVNVGCVPKKLMVLGAHFADEWRDAAAFGWDVSPPRRVWSRLIDNKDREIARLNGIYERLLRDRGVEISFGRATLAGPHEVDVHVPGQAPRRVRAKKILVAVGGAPVRLDVPGQERAMISDDVFALRELPARILVVGGGYIAVEFAGVFAGYGAQVTLVHRGALFLRGFDRDVRVHLDQEMRKHGIDLRFHRSVARIAEGANGAHAVELTDGSTLEVDAILTATGRAPKTSDLGLDAAGVRTDARGAILVDARFRTSAPSIYAVGDVIDRVALTPVALAEGMIVAHDLFGSALRQADYEMIPSAVFSNPPIGTVGLTEEEARLEFSHVDTYRSVFTPMKQTLAGSSEKTLMKLVVDRSSDRVVGLHMVGPDAGEIVQGFAVALKCGATKAQFDRTIGIHPTAAEEFVTLRERCPDPDRAQTIEHEVPRKRAIVVHRWEDGEG